MPLHPFPVAPVGPRATTMTRPCVPLPPAARAPVQCRCAAPFRVAWTWPARPAAPACWWLRMPAAAVPMQSMAELRASSRSSAFRCPPRASRTQRDSLHDPAANLQPHWKCRSRRSRRKRHRLKLGIHHRRMRHQGDGISDANDRHSRDCFTHRRTSVPYLRKARPASSCQDQPAWPAGMFQISFEQPAVPG